MWPVEVAVVAKVPSGIPSSEFHFSAGGHLCEHMFTVLGFMPCGVPCALVKW